MDELLTISNIWLFIVFYDWNPLHIYYDFDVLVQERRNCIANAMELHISCTNIWFSFKFVPEDCIEENLPLIEVMAWSCTKLSRYLNQWCMIQYSSSGVFNCCQTSNIRHTNSLKLKCFWIRLAVVFCPIHWSQVLSREWRCSWSSAERRCSNYIWMINNFIASQGVTYIRGLTIGTIVILLLCNLCCF